MVSSSQGKERFVLPSVRETANKPLDFDFNAQSSYFNALYYIPVSWHLIVFPAVSACWSMLHFIILIGVLMGLELLQKYSQNLQIFPSLRHVIYIWPD